MNTITSTMWSTTNLTTMEGTTNPIMNLTTATVILHLRVGSPASSQVQVDLGVEASAGLEVEVSVDSGVVSKGT